MVAGTRKRLSENVKSPLISKLNFSSEQCDFYISFVISKKIFPKSEMKNIKRHRTVLRLIAILELFKSVDVNLLSL